MPLPTTTTSISFLKSRPIMRSLTYPPTTKPSTFDSLATSLSSENIGRSRYSLIIVSGIGNLYFDRKNTYSSDNPVPPRGINPGRATSAWTPMDLTKAHLVRADERRYGLQQITLPEMTFLTQHFCRLCRNLYHDRARCALPGARQ